MSFAIALSNAWAWLAGLPVAWPALGVVTLVAIFIAGIMAWSWKRELAEMSQPREIGLVILLGILMIWLGFLAIGESEYAPRMEEIHYNFHEVKK